MGHTAPYSSASLAFLACIITLLRTYGQEIRTEQGAVVGKEEVSENGKIYFAFRGIPYAQPPIGDLRWKVPKPLDNWKGAFDALEDPPSCPQAGLGYNEGQEDCLYLNVFTPKLTEVTPKSPLPVLVWLHGGAFVTGSASNYDPYFIMNRKVILVIPQYRLGIFGWYSTKSETAIGNYGLLDQQVALKWVRDNIGHFGGDPLQVTLGGDCAGGASAVYHMLTPLSEGLFHRIVSFSGSPLSPWALLPSHRRLILMLSNELECPNYDLKLMTKCFNQKTTKELMDAQQILLQYRDPLVGNHKLAPGIQDPESTNDTNVLLDRHPLDILLDGRYTKVPVILEVTRDVGAYIVDMTLYDFFKERMEDVPDFLSKMLLLLIPELGFSDPQSKEGKFREYYLPNWNYDSLESSIPGLEKILSDTLYNAGILALGRILSENTETHFLRFDYEGGPKLFDLRHPIASESPPVTPGRVSLGDDLFLFSPYFKMTLTAQQKKAADGMLDILLNFTYGRVSDNWKPLTKGGLEAMVITGEGEMRMDQLFTTSQEEMLNFIFSNQHQKLIEKRSLHHDEL